MFMNVFVQVAKLTPKFKFNYAQMLFSPMPAMALKVRLCRELLIVKPFLLKTMN